MPEELKIMQMIDFTMETMDAELAATLLQLSQAANQDKFDQLNPPEPSNYKKCIENILHSITGSDASEESKRSCYRQLRHIHAIADGYLEELYPGDQGKQEVLRAVLAEFREGIIGPSPMIDEVELTLPEEEFLQRDFKDKKIKWQQLMCPNPSRQATSIKKGKIGFFSRDDQSAPREELKSRFKSSDVKILKVGGKELYLNVTDFHYYHQTLMHADHGTPSTELIRRQKELVELMNYHPKLREQMLGSHDKDGYFLVNPDNGEIVGSYWYYAVHHNTLDNLRFLVASENIGATKGAIDPISWLESFDMGKEFLAHLKRNGEKINRASLFYRLSSKTSLINAFDAWALKTYKHAYEAAHAISHRTEIELSQVKSLSERKSQKLVRQHEEAAAATEFGQDDSTSSDSCGDESGVSSVDRSTLRKVMAIKMKNDPTVQELQKQLKKEKRRIHQQATGALLERAASAGVAGRAALNHVDPNRESAKRQAMEKTNAQNAANDEVDNTGNSIATSNPPK